MIKFILEQLIFSARLTRRVTVNADSNFYVSELQRLRQER